MNAVIILRSPLNIVHSLLSFHLIRISFLSFHSFINKSEVMSARIIIMFISYILFISS